MFEPASAAPPLSGMTMSELMKRRADVEAKIESAEAAWMEASEALETFAA